MWGSLGAIPKMWSMHHVHIALDCCRCAMHDVANFQTNVMGRKAELQRIALERLMGPEGMLKMSHGSDENSG